MCLLSSWTVAIPGFPLVIFEIIKDLLFSPSLSKQQNSSPKSTNPYPAAPQFSQEINPITGL